MDALALFICLGLLGGGTATTWFLRAKSKHHSNSSSIGFCVLGFVFYFIGLFIIWKVMPITLERNLLRLMPDFLFRILEWLASAIFSYLLALIIIPVLPVGKQKKI